MVANQTGAEDKRDPVLDQVRQLFGRAVYTHKTHEKDRERLSRLGTILRWFNVVLGALTLGGIVAAIFGSQGTTQLVLSGILATINVGAALAQLSFDPLGQAAFHRDAAKQLVSVRDGYETLIADIVSGSLRPEDVRARRDALQSRAQEAYRYAPDTSRRGYALAQKGLKVSEDMTFSAAEIDALLPEALRYAPTP